MVSIRPFSLLTPCSFPTPAMYLQTLYPSSRYSPLPALLMTCLSHPPIIPLSTGMDLYYFVATFAYLCLTLPEYEFLKVRIIHQSNQKSWPQVLRGRKCIHLDASYPTSKVRSGSHEELPHVQGKEQWLHFAGAAVKRYPTSKVRETQVRR